MNDLKINNILRVYTPTSNKFRGVFGKNELGPVERYPCCMIVNESDFGTRGTHWVAVYFDLDGNCEYFDSYGQFPVPAIERFLSHNTRGVCQMNTKQFQSYNSDVCGQYCIYYLTKRCENISMNKILSVLDVNTRRENDHFVLQYVHNKFNC